MTIVNKNWPDTPTDNLIKALTKYKNVDKTNIRKEIDKLNSCFAKYSPEQPYISHTVFAFERQDLDEVMDIDNLEKLTKKVNDQINSENTENEQYLAIASLINTVIYFQYKLNIIRESKQIKLTPKREQFTKKYLTLLDNRYKLKEKIVENGFYTEIGRFGNPSINPKH